MTLLGAIVKQVNTERDGCKSEVWSNCNTLIYVELRSIPLTKIADSCQPDVVGRPKYWPTHLGAGRESKPSREWTSRYLLYSTFQLVPQNGINDHSITEGDNVDCLKDPITLQTDNSNHEIL